jgi:hypothetical protein
MYLMYIDESGDPGIHENSPTRYFIMSSIVFHELRWRDLLDNLVDFRRHLRNTKNLKLRDEIHSTDFINSPGELKRIKRHDRVDVMKQCIDWVASNSEISVTTVCIDKHNRRSTDDVFEFAWTLLIQRFENTMRNKNFPGPANPDDRGIIFPDNTDGKKLQGLLRKLRRFNPVPNDTSYFTGGYRNMNIQYVIEDPLLKDSRNSFFNQIVDVIAYSARQIYEPNNYMKKKGGHNFYKRLDPVINKAATAKHPLGIVEQ